MPNKDETEAYGKIVDTLPTVLADAVERFPDNPRMTAAIAKTRTVFDKVLSFALNPSAAKPVLSPFADMDALKETIADLTKRCMRMEAIAYGAYLEGEVW